MPLKSEAEGEGEREREREKGGAAGTRADSTASNIERRCSLPPFRIEFFSERIVQSFVSFGNYRFYAASLAGGDRYGRSENGGKRARLENGTTDRRFNFHARALVDRDLVSL